MKEKITEQSVFLFEKKGYSETSIQDIVDSLGVTKGTFYYYFSSKEELLMDIQLRYIDELLEHQESILNDTTKDSKSKLFEIVYMSLTSIKKQGSSARIFFREMKNLSEESLTKIMPKRDQYRLNIERLVKEGIEKKEFRNDLNPIIVTFGILGIMNWTYQWFSPKGSLSEREVSEIYVEMLLNGIQIK